MRTVGEPGKRRRAASSGALAVRSLTVAPGASSSTTSRRVWRPLSWFGQSSNQSSSTTGALPIPPPPLGSEVAAPHQYRTPADQSTAFSPPPPPPPLSPGAPPPLPPKNPNPPAAPPPRVPTTTARDSAAGTLLPAALPCPLWSQPK